MSIPQKLFIDWLLNGSLFPETSASIPFPMFFEVVFIDKTQHHLVRHYKQNFEWFSKQQIEVAFMRTSWIQTSVANGRLKITLPNLTYAKAWTGSVPLCPLIFSWSLPILCFHISSSYATYQASVSCGERILRDIIVVVWWQWMCLKQVMWLRPNLLFPVEHPSHLQMSDKYKRWMP